MILAACSPIKPLSVRTVTSRYGMRRRKPMPTLLPTQWIFNLSHHIGIVSRELAFDDTESYTWWGGGGELAQLGRGQWGM